MPVLYYIRHGETDWNVEQRLQGHRDTALNARGRGQATHCGAVLRDLFARDGPRSRRLRLRVEPAQSGAADHGARARRARVSIRAPTSVDDRLIEISFGDWEGLTLARDRGAQRRTRSPSASATSGDLRRPAASAIAALTERVGAWYAIGRPRHRGRGPWRRRRAALIAHFNILPHEEAAHADIVHGVVYVFADGTMARYA